MITKSPAAIYINISAPIVLAKKLLIDSISLGYSTSPLHFGHFGGSNKLILLTFKVRGGGEAGVPRRPEGPECT